MRVRTHIGALILLALPCSVAAQTAPDLTASATASASSAEGFASQPKNGPAAMAYFDSISGLTLEQAITRALENEPALRAARAEIDIARGVERQAGLRPNPSIAIERREEPGGTDNQTMASVQWPLDLFRRDGRVAVAQHERAATELAVADRERLLAADVRERYGALLVELRNLAVLDEMVTSVESQRALLDSRVQEGASPALDRDLVEVELRRWQADRLLQRGRVDAALVRLKRSLGLGPADLLKVREPLDVVVAQQGPPGEAASSALEQRPDLRGAQARIQVADAKVDRARRDARFDVSLFGSYARMDAGFMQQGLSPEGELMRVRGVFNYVAVGAMVMVPLFNRNQGDVAAARAERSAAMAAYEAVSLDAAAELAAARAVDDRAREGVRIFTGGARAGAAQNVDVVRQSYALGRATVFDVLAEQRRFLDFERAYTEVLQSAYDARTALLKAAGPAFRSGAQGGVR